MSITFRVDDGLSNSDIAPAHITADQLAALCALLSAESERRQIALTIAELGDPSEPEFAFEARICQLALAPISACCDHDAAVIAVLDEAQFRGRRVRISKDEDATEIRLAMSWNLDAAPELNVSNSNAFAILEMLGLRAESTGAIPLAEFRSRLSDPSTHRRLNAEPGLQCYMESLTQMARLGRIDCELDLAWA